MGKVQVAMVANRKRSNMATDVIALLLGAMWLLCCLDGINCQGKSQSHV